MDFGAPPMAWDGQTATHYAARGGHVEVMEVLGADHFEAPGSDGGTPLLAAAEHGRLDVVKALMAARCDMDKADDHGTTPVLAAAEFGHLDVVKALTEAGCDIEENGGASVLGAARYGHLDVVKALIEVRCAIDKANNDGWTPVFAAALNGHVDVLQFLAPLVDVNVSTAGGGARPLDVALSGAAAEVLANAGARGAPRPRLVGLTALRPRAAPPEGWACRTWITCGLPEMARGRGKFYFEIQILSGFENPQVGWLSTEFERGDSDLKGVGDDQHGWAFDGRRRKIWHDGDAGPLPMKAWKVNDVLGFALDIDTGEMRFQSEHEEESVAMPLRAQGTLQLELTSFSALCFGLPVPEASRRQTWHVLFLRAECRPGRVHVASAASV